MKRYCALVQQSGAAPVMVERGVARDAEEPGARRAGVGPVAAVGLVGVDEHFGSHVLRVGRASDLDADVRVDAGEELTVQLLERRLGAGH